MLNQCTYLYLEDDLFSREIMQMIMTSGMGIEKLVMFEDSHDFLARVKALGEAVEVFLLDIHITPCDGFELLAMLRADAAYSRAKIVALTASVMNEEIEKLRQAGFDGAIAKPISIQTFPQLLVRIVDGESVWHIE